MIPNGTYIAKLRSTSIIYLAGKEDEPEEGRALMGFLPMTITEGDQAGQNIEAQICFKAKDGKIMTRTIENMQEVFGMQGANPFWMQFENPDDANDARVRDLSTKTFNIVVESETYNQKTTAKVKWINPLGGGAWTPKPADRKSILAKHGAQFRALSGPVSKPANTPPKKPAQTTQTGPSATVEEAWLACCTARSMNEADATASWNHTLAAMFPEKLIADFTPQDWGKVKEKFSDDIPFSQEPKSLETKVQPPIEVTAPVNAGSPVPQGEQDKPVSGSEKQEPAASDDFDAPPSQQQTEEKKKSADLDAVFGTAKAPFSPLDCYEYLIAKKQLVRGAGLETVPAIYALKVIRNAGGFMRSVEAWVKGGRK